ncbi:ABC transporter substrate-binding protein [Parasporobacterium paucivorans]|uniref:Amino acid/amide ABC transporter substrate-binding protein, HAAT family n=1 Tax=Parasporobacterium paucivorans DSM 15970 TaxID=1122934 RepID=A0A1M6GM70_9FIRM|nr:ABC transporter substrate-binding protein [Parasporobacterium paucivorans]SHJ11064.1 amino acid/amide ABC transporter substrate-binding protein, HAAT family [Parasporobacterium paucivorans DSM 15970]
MKKTKLFTLLVCLISILSVSLIGCGTGGTNTGNTSDTTDNSERTSIKIGVPVPLTGGLANFGTGSPFIEELAAKAINDQGGIYIKELDKKLPVELIFMDTESSQTKASEAATKLVTENKVDMLVVRHTPDTVNPVSAVAERYGVPCLSMDAASDAWLASGKHVWSYHAFWKVDSIYKTFESIWEKAGLKGAKVGVVFPNDPDGTTFSPIFAKGFKKDGFGMVDPGFVTSGTNDYTSIIKDFKDKGVEIVTGVNITPDFATFWSQCQQLNFKPKMVTMGKALLFKSDTMALGVDNANGVTTEIWWTPDHPYVSSLTGQTGREITDLWTAATGTEWTQPMGYKYASIEVAIDILKRAASLDKETIRQAMDATDMTSLVGPIKFDDDNHCATPVVGGQWQKNANGELELKIVTNDGYPEIALTGTLQTSN